MLSSASAPPSGSRSVAANAFRKAGLMDHDERMRDVADKPGGRKGHAKTNSHKVRSSYRTRGAEALLGKDQPGPSTRYMVNSTSLRRVAHPACCYACLLSVCPQCVH